MSNYVVIDLEMCRVPDIKKKQFEYTSEIIEIGAVLLDDTFKISDTFKTYVSPEYGRIDTYIENLTKITNKDVCSAPVLKDALKMFFEWLPEDTVMVAWSNNDSEQLNKETEYKNIQTEQLTLLLKNAIDCQVMFGKKMDSPKVYRLSEALIIANIEYDEGAHDALVDAHNTALLFEKIMNDEEFTLNPYYENTNSGAPAYCPFADLLADAVDAI